MISVEQTRSGVITLKYNNKYIHSRYDPITEGNKFAEQYTGLKDSMAIVVYGLGLGYHIDGLLKILDNNTKIIVFEWNRDIVSCCQRYNSKVIKDSRVIIISEDNIDFYNVLSRSINEYGNIIIHKPSLEVLKNNNDKLYSIINEFLINMKSIKKSSQMLKDNFEENKKANYSLMQDFIRQNSMISKEFVITASGPSLDDELELLRKNRDRFIVFSAGSSLRSLMNKGIKPDAVFIIDGKPIVRNQLTGYENEDIPLCFLNTASKEAVKSYNGPKYMFFNDNSDNENNIVTGKTVAVAALYSAIKCGAKRIIMLGQDLAFIGNKSHTNTFKETYKFEDNVKDMAKGKTVEGVDGSLLYTTEGYLYFKHQIERLINRFSNIDYINCSKGAKIEGAVSSSFDDYLSSR